MRKKKVIIKDLGCNLVVIPSSLSLQLIADTMTAFLCFVQFCQCFPPRISSEEQELTSFQFVKKNLLKAKDSLFPAAKSILPVTYCLQCKTGVPKRADIELLCKQILDISVIQEVFIFYIMGKKWIPAYLCIINMVQNCCLDISVFQ